jgi:hypothetical protein
LNDLHDLGVHRKAALAVLREDQLTVDGDVKNAARALDQARL